MTDASDKANEKLIAKYGSPEALKKKRQEWQRKSRVNYSGNGGFRSLSPEERKEAARKGALARWGNNGKAKNS